MSPSWPRLEKRPMVTCENGYGNGQLVCHSRHGWSWHAGSSRSVRIDPQEGAIV